MASNSQFTGRDMPTKTRSIFLIFQPLLGSPSAWFWSLSFPRPFPQDPLGRKCWSMANKPAGRSWQLCNFLKLHFGPPILTFCTLPHFIKPLNFLSFSMRPLCSKTFISSFEDSEKIFFRPPSDKFGKLYLGLNFRLGRKLYRFFLKKLKGWSLRKTRSPSRFRWILGSPL